MQKTNVGMFDFPFDSPDRHGRAKILAQLLHAWPTRGHKLSSENQIQLGRQIMTFSPNSAQPLGQH
jgi:hypothetical protein